MAVAVKSLQDAGHDVVSHDLYAENFNPSLPVSELDREAPLDPVIEKHCADLSSADGIVIIHPNWWSQPPAILKGWIDRVIRPGVAYSFKEGDSGEGVPVGLLKASSAVVFTTSNTPDEREKAVFGDPLENLWKTCILGFCGVKNFQRRNYGVMVASTPGQRKAWLEDVRHVVNGAFPSTGKAG